VKTEAARVIVVHPRENRRLATVATKIRDAFAACGFDAAAQAAEDSMLPHLSAASILILAADSGGAGFAEGPYREIRRACSGVNYAGRLATFFSSDADADAALAEMLGPTDIDLSVPPLSHGANGVPDTDAVSQWVAQVARRYEEMMNERHV
jgi:hypothetical protein